MKLQTFSVGCVLLALTTGCGDSKTNKPGSSAGEAGAAVGGASEGATSGSGAVAGAGASSGGAGSHQGGAGAGENAGGTAAGAGGAGGGDGFGTSNDRLGVGSRLCAINQDQDLVCWEDEPETRPGPFIGVSINQDAICTLRASGEATCLGAGDPPAGERFIAVRTMQTRACGQRADKTVLCWGEDVSGNVSEVTKSPVADFAVSRITCTANAGKPPTCWGPTPLAPPPQVEVSQLVSSYDFVCGIGLDATIHCWGAEQYAPAAPGFEKAAMVDYLGDAWGCALTTNKSLSCWGTAPITAEQRQGLQVADFAIGQEAICVVLTDRSVKCFGGPAAPVDLRVY
jgi:hypothetical protein